MPRVNKETVDSVAYSPKRSDQDPSCRALLWFERFREAETKSRVSMLFSLNFNKKISPGVTEVLDGERCPWPILLHGGGLI